MTDQHRELAIQYFDAYPEEHVLHISQDGQVFLHSNHSDAINHQRSLTTEPITTISRKELGAYAPAFDYDSMTEEEQAAYDKAADEIREEERKNEEALKAKIEEEERVEAEQAAKDKEEAKGEEVKQPEAIVEAETPVEISDEVKESPTPDQALPEAQAKTPKGAKKTK